MIPILILLINCKRYIDFITIKKSKIIDVSYRRLDMNKLNNYFFEELEKYIKREHLVEIENDIIKLLKEKSQSIKSHLYLFLAFFLPSHSAFLLLYVKNYMI